MNAVKNRGRKAWVRFPNEGIFEEINIDLSEFMAEKEFEDESFGWYRGIYISVKK
jgi:hypothetical protein